MALYIKPTAQPPLSTVLLGDWPSLHCEQRFATIQHRGCRSEVTSTHNTHCLWVARNFQQTHLLCMALALAIVNGTAWTTPDTMQWQVHVSSWEMQLLSSQFTTSPKTYYFTSLIKCLSQRCTNGMSTLISDLNGH